MTSSSSPSVSFVAVAVAVAAAIAVAAVAFSGCTTTGHAAAPSRLGRAATSADLLESLATPGPIQAETIASADWVVDRGGLINLDHPKAVAAGLEDGDEPVQIYFHVLRHPERGTFIIDTGVERALRDAPKEAAVRGLIASAMKAERMTIHRPLGDWLKDEGGKLDGVLLTHLHLDHATGLPDVPRNVPVYAGPGETSARSFQNLFTRGTLNRMLNGMGPVQEWGFPAAPAAPAASAEDVFEGVVDVFGDGSLWAIWVPGHTPGSTAYLARTANGPVLFVGDTCHTDWGWQNGVEPGAYTADHDRNARNLERLRALVRANPEIEVRLGHQPHGGGGAKH